MAHFRPSLPPVINVNIIIIFDLSCDECHYQGVIGRAIAKLVLKAILERLDHGLGWEDGTALKTSPMSAWIMIHAHKWTQWAGSAEEENVL